MWLINKYIINLDILTIAGYSAVTVETWWGESIVHSKQRSPACHDPGSCDPALWVLIYFDVDGLSSLIYLRSFLLCLGCRRSPSFLWPLFVVTPVFTFPMFILISCFSMCFLLTSCVCFHSFLVVCYSMLVACFPGFSCTFVKSSQFRFFTFTLRDFFMFSISSPSLGQFLVLPCFVQLKPAFNKWLTFS